MTYMCKKCGRLISHRMMWSARLTYEDLFGHPAPEGVPELVPTVLPRCPYCGLSEDRIGGYWCYKQYDLKHTWREAVRHQRNVVTGHEMEDEAEVAKDLIITNDMSDLEYFSAFADVRKRMKAGVSA